MRAARLTRMLAGIGVLLALVGCMPLPGSQPQQPPETSAPSDTANPPETTAPAEPLFAYTTDESAGTVWSFEPTGATIVETDYDGTPADPGHVLVVLFIDGQRLSESGNFYWDFRVGSVNPETDQLIGLSSGTDFYATNDLYTAGQLPNFRDAQAIFQVPEDWPLGHWRFVFHETGEEWEMDVPVDGA